MISKMPMIKRLRSFTGALVVSGRLRILLDEILGLFQAAPSQFANLSDLSNLASFFGGRIDAHVSANRIVKRDVAHNLEKKIVETKSGGLAQLMIRLRKNLGLKRISFLPNSLQLVENGIVLVHIFTHTIFDDQQLLVVATGFQQIVRQSCQSFH